MKYQLCFFLLLLIVQLTAEAQNNTKQLKIDSLLYKVKKSSFNADRVALINEFAGVSFTQPEISQTGYDQISYYLKQALSLCDSLHDMNEWKHSILCYLGYGYIRSGNVTEGSKVFMGLIKFNHQLGDKQKEAEGWYKYGAALLVLDKDIEIADTAFTNSINIYHAANDARNEIKTRIVLADLHFRIGKQKIAEQEYFSILKISASHASYKMADIYFLLSELNRYGSKFDIALGYALQAVSSMEATKDSARADNYYGELALVYQAMNKPIESAYWYKKCLLKRENMFLDPYVVYATYGLLVRQLIKISQSQEALVIIKDVARRRPPNGAKERAAIAQAFAYCYEATGAYELAEKYFLETLSEYTRAGIEGELLEIALHDIIQFYLSNKQFEKGSAYLNKLLSLGSTTMSRQADLELFQFKIDSAAGRYVNAIRHFQDYKYLNDSLFNAAKDKQFEEINIQYETDKMNKDITVKDQRIKLLTKNNQLQAKTLRQEKTTRNMVLATTFLLILLLGLSYNRYRLKQRTNKKLEAQQKEISEKNTSLERLLTEKEWLVKEIHHRVKNNFHIVMGLLETQLGYLKNEEAKSAVSESQQRVHAMSLIHQKLYQAEDLSAINMPAYVNELVEYLKDSFDVKQMIRFNLQIERIDLDVSYSIPIGLILNEAITNAIKHAFPGKNDGTVEILLKHTGEDTLLLSIADNGVGITEAVDVNSHPSMGMNLMKGLSKDIGGVFSMKRKHGTLININFTYDPDILTDIISKTS
ncbi:MAG: histidine kinase dimerization/phosphoacceptor domain -containing protein [Ferruginibacter sp.]